MENLQTTKTQLQLHQALIRYFSEAELQMLAFNLNIDYENLPGHTKAERARELIAYVDRQGRLNELVTQINVLRPNADLAPSEPFYIEIIGSDIPKPYFVVVLRGVSSPTLNVTREVLKQSGE